jgi:putative inorganic carbon (HCO3(-)) transporter
VVWLATLVLTQSRGGWIGAASGVLTFLALWGLTGKRGWHRALGIAIPLFIILVVSVVLVSLGPDRIGQLLYGSLEGTIETSLGPISFEGRVEIWSRALFAIHDFPLTGVGLGAFRRVVTLVYPPFLVGLDHDIAHAHNIFLQMAVDLGIPGLVAYVALLIVVCWVAWRKLHTGGQDRWIALGVLSGVVGLHAFGLADALALGSKPAFLFWAMLGLLGMDHRHDQGE